MTDDQVLRAERLPADGLGISARTAEEVAAAVDRLSDEAVRSRMRMHIEDLAMTNGAVGAADALAGMAVRHHSAADEQE